MNDREKRRLIEQLEAEQDMLMYGGSSRKPNYWALKEVAFALLGLSGFLSVLWMVWDHYYG